MPKSGSSKDGETKLCCLLCGNKRTGYSFFELQTKKIPSSQRSHLSRGRGLTVYGKMTWPRHAVPLIRVWTLSVNWAKFCSLNMSISGRWLGGVKGIKLVTSVGKIGVIPNFYIPSS